MPMKPVNMVRGIKYGLEERGLKKNIPLQLFYTEFMLQSGYGKKKILEWTENFKILKLITVVDGEVNFTCS